jgi:hypothetical protein
MVARFSIIRQVVEIERKLTDTKFKLYGCMYFKEDIPQGDRLVITGTVSPLTLERFTMGPLVDMDHWRKVKASMDLNRRPCKYICLTPDNVNTSTLEHPDLHFDNLFVDPNTLQVTSVIDWQSTAAAPLFYQYRVPKMVRQREPVSLDLSN